MAAPLPTPTPTIGDDVLLPPVDTDGDGIPDDQEQPPIDSDGDGIPDDQEQPPPAGAASPVGSWVYAGGTAIDAEGESNVSVSGTLELSADGRWHSSRYISGAPSGQQFGTYVVQGDRLLLTDERTGETQDFGFVLGTHTDANGVVYRALTLDSADETGTLRYLLTEATGG